MPDPRIEIDVPAWVERARNDPVAYRSRQATEIILTAIAASAALSENLCLKGGVLMGLAYDSPARQPISTCRPGSSRHRKTPTQSKRHSIRPSRQLLQSSAMLAFPCRSIRSRWSRDGMVLTPSSLR